MKENCPSNAGLLDYGFPGEWWFRGFTIGKLHQAGNVLFPLSENKASLSQPDLMFLGVTCAS